VMMLTHKRLSRRTMLRGLGATIALPLLDSMVPALSALRTTAAAGVRRMAIIYTPNGMMMPNWTPKGEGAAFEFSPILEALTPYRDQLLVLSGLADRYGWPQGDEGTGDHARAAATFLTGVHVKKTEGADIQGGVSMDQIAAKALGAETQLASLELALESVELLGACDSGYSCAYANTIAWRSPATPLPMENDPRAVFERLFGATDTTDAAARLARIAKERSILDSVSSDLQRLQKRVGAADRTKVTDYLDAVRDIERRIQKAEEQSTKQLPLVQQPSGVPATFEEHARLMFELMALAYQTDLTRVCTYMIGREQSTRTYPEIGVPEPHHPISHHQQRPEYLEKLAKINVFHMKLFAGFLEKLRATQDGDGTLLDSVMLLYGSGLSNPDDHNHHDLPILLAGGGGGQLKGGRHIKYPLDTPLANLHMALLDKMGVPIDRFGDSTGKVELLSGV